MNTVHNGQNGTESLETTIASVFDSNGYLKTLASSLKISIVKTPVYIRYPLTYFRV